MFGKKMRPLKIVTSFSLSLSPSLSFASTTTPGKRTPRKNNHHQNRKRGGEDGGPETTTRTTFGGFVGRKKKNGEEEEEEEEEGHQSRIVGPFARRFRGTKIEFRFRKKRALFFIALLLKSIVRTEEHKLTRHDAPFFFFSFLCDDRTPCSRKSSAREMRFESTTTSKSRVVVTVKAFVKRRRRRRL